MVVGECDLMVVVRCLALSDGDRYLLLELSLYTFFNIWILNGIY